MKKIDSMDIKHVSDIHRTLGLAPMARTDGKFES